MYKAWENTCIKSERIHVYVEWENTYIKSKIIHV